MKLPININLSKKQKLAFDTLEKKSIDELLYGGAKGGGKSWLGCDYCAVKSVQIIKQCDIKPQDKPIPVGFMGRKVGEDFRNTTLNTWYKSVPSDLYRIVGKPAEIIILNRVKILTGGLDRREEINKFNSAELAFYFIDQAEETNEDDINVLRAASHNRLIINDITLPGKGLFTANPAQCWLKTDFILNPTKNRRFIQALPGENPYLGDKYIETLKDAFRHRPEMLQAYLFGNWDAFEGADQVIKEVWLRAAFSRSNIFIPYEKIFIVIDTARFGDDETVIYLMKNLDISKKIVMPWCKTTEISSRAAVLSYENYDCPIVVESIGSDLGAGVADELTDLGKEVIIFNPAKKSTKPDKYYSLRCQVWHEAAQMLSDGIIDREENIPVVITKNDPDDPQENYGMDYETIGQLCSPKYKWRSGKLLIEPKEDTKARIGRSPDHADPFIIATWAWPLISRFRPKPKKDGYREEETVGSAMDGW